MISSIPFVNIVLTDMKKPILSLKYKENLKDYLGKVFKFTYSGNGGQVCVQH